MKKITMFMAIFIFMANCVTAQDTIANGSFVSIGINHTQSNFLHGISADFCFMEKISKKWDCGLGICIGHGNSSQFESTNTSSMPFTGFEIQRFEDGLFLAAAYSTSFGIFTAEYLYGFPFTQITASDDRCNIWVEDEEGDYITNSYTISRADGKNWFNFWDSSLRVSYLLPVYGCFHIRIFMEYEFIPYLREELINDNVQVTSSNWDEFETYYGQPIVNLYEASETVRKICSANRFNFGIGLILR